ncbi:Cysteine--tRNA ligase [Candidatus Hepatincolaceae symbiont of Richtersius coronifer]
MLYLHNSLSNTKELFKPLDLKHIKMYVCGPTVYDDIHIGNARPIIVFDVLYRLLQTIYPKVTYVRNITDIDDKIIQRAMERQISINNLTHDTTISYHQDISFLNVLSPTFEPKATEHIKDMQDIIQILLDKGFAYLSNNKLAKQEVMFAINKFKDYGKLSGLKQEDILPGARVEIDVDKQYSSDFILWKPSLEGEIGWPSPWGYGRPGWHIECSAMAKHYLGDNFDIHGGGIDLLFPHHENERAQSICCCFKEQASSISSATIFPDKFANYWLHNGFLMVEGQKMSKSLGNFLTLKDTLKTHHGETIRLAMLMTHYRQPLNFKENTLAQAKNVLDKFYSLLGKAIIQYQKVSNRIFVPNFTFNQENIVKNDFLAALLDDLNTPKALSILHQDMSFLNDLLNQSENCSASNKLEQTINQIIVQSKLLGILQAQPQAWHVLTNVRSLNEEEFDKEEIAQLLQERNLARKINDYAKADHIRQQLYNKGIILKDAKDGSTWERR